MRLTSDHVQRVHRKIDDPGRIPGLAYHTDADFDELVRTIRSSGQADNDFWFFACGSLIWKPACEFVEHRRAIARGWHRAFAMRITRFRATPERPGLMMGLDRGGECRGIVYRLPPDAVETCLGKLFRREMSIKPSNNIGRWISVQTDEGPLRAIAFVINRHGPNYVRGLTMDQIAEQLAFAVGHAGSCAEYLHNTVKHLEEFGLNDHHLWRLQKMVAERIEAANAATIDP
jgi:cation transport protein ChaC